MSNATLDARFRIDEKDAEEILPGTMLIEALRRNCPPEVVLAAMRNVLGLSFSDFIRDRPPVRLTAETKASIVARARTGEYYNRIAADVGCHWSYVAVLAKRAGVPRIHWTRKPKGGSPRGAVEAR
jgi:hypothetical protein